MVDVRLPDSGQPVYARPLATQRTRTPNHKSPQNTTQKTGRALKKDTKPIPVIRMISKKKKPKTYDGYVVAGDSKD